MTKTEFIKRLVGRTITEVELADKDSWGDVVPEDEILINAIKLDDGSKVYFQGSGQIDVEDVWVFIREET